MDVSVPCICEGSPHADDTITLREKLDFRQASTVRNAVILLKANDPSAKMAEVLSVLSEAQILVGIESWTVVDEKGKPLPVTTDAVAARLLPNVDAAMAVSDASDQLFGEVMLPLVLRAFKPSPPSPTTRSTSPTNGSPPKPPKPSKRSSITTIPTVATEATSKSLVGGSSSLPSSESAA